jgi:hypothetical protein
LQAKRFFASECEKGIGGPLMTIEDRSRNVNARQAVDLIRSSLPNGELMERFKISAKGFGDLLKQLFEKKLISEEDLTRRGIRFKVLKKDQIAAPKPPSAPAPQSIQPAPRHDDEEEFLDTVALTELLSFKPMEPPPPKKKKVEEEIPPAEEIRIETSDKKSRFSISSIFKKG